MPKKTKSELEMGNDKTMKNETKVPSLEESFHELDQVIEMLEKEDINLEDSFQLYHKGMELLKRCNNSIDKIEKELLILEESGIS